MKKIFFFAISACLIISCSKSGNTNPLVGSWSQIRSIDQYQNPYSLVVEYDTLWGGGTSVEFRKDGGYYVNGTQTYTYKLNNSSSFTLTPPGQVPVEYGFIVSANELKTWRNGVDGEQLKIFNPDNSGEFKMANILQVFSEYTKQ
jgi:hypothetical protein